MIFYHPSPPLLNPQSLDAIGLFPEEQKKYLKDFNPRNSARVRRKKDRVEYFDTVKPQK